MYIHRERQRGPGDSKHTEHWKGQKIRRRTDYTERDKGHWERLRLQRHTTFTLAKTENTEVTV